MGIELYQVINRYTEGEIGALHCKESYKGMESLGEWVRKVL